MSRQVIKKDNGKFAVWSTIIDDFVFDDISPDEYIAARIKEETEHVKQDLRDIFSAVVNDNAKEYYLQFTMTYNQACKRRDEIHGKNKHSK